MESPILKSSIQEFINNSLTIPLSKLALQKNPFPEVEWIDIVKQIEAKAKSKDKLPLWFQTESIIYPTKISIEQTSSEKTALYKSTLVSGESLIDLTGGFGIDDFYFSKVIPQIIHCEINPELSNIVSHNLKQLQVSNIKCCVGDSRETLLHLSQKWDWIYIDPSRRNDAKGKVFLLKDCLPNVPENLDFYFEYSNKILIKTAPLLDLSSALTELKNVKNIHVIALENEVKELLWEIHKEYVGPVSIKTANLLKDKTEVFDFILGENSNEPLMGMPKRYIYEPNSAIMKSGGFTEVALNYNLEKLHKHSHLYTSDELIDFPGRRFEIHKVVPYNKSEIKTELSNTKSNITTRNFPETVENIRKKWKIKDGGTTYSFFTTIENNDKIVLICNKIP
ncbi:THUMP-like domain-containing protein [Flavobacterium algicola]|uniref:THUMP-like domain-containing protein n=1 Tax=Flavobacterium algicola TaxID=556529 RepID=UPI001EFDD527|nr:class I SAM-dependent methyltransferase [Flavobacterium algicola]MCG9792569.1 class I SAM-dependent methyltransferase [Flavobacterium algicola]